MRKILAWTLLVLLAAVQVLRAQTTTTVSGTIYTGDAVAPSGSLILSWPAFTAADNSAVAAGTKTFTVTSGDVNLTLIPNAGASPSGTSYTADFRLTGIGRSLETWVVPASGPVGLGAVRVLSIPVPTAAYISTLNGLTAVTQTFTLTSPGTASTITSTGSTHTFSFAGDAIPDANQNFGAFYSDFAQIAAPANPGAGVRRLFTNSATGEISVRTSAGATVSLEGGGGSVPTGTGFRHVTGGVEDAASKLVENADVAAAAGIVESKLALNFATHAQAHALVGADHTASGLTIGHYVRATGATTFAFGAVLDADLPSTLARDSEINVQGTASEITSSGSGVAPVLSLDATVVQTDVAKTFTTLQTFDPGTTPAQAILLSIAQPGGAGQRDSHFLDLTGTSFDTGGHDADWRAFVDVTSNAAASTFTLQSRIDVAAFASRLTITDGGVVTATTFVGALTGNASTATALAADGGNCTGNNFALGVDASGIAQCAQPAFSNLSGAATKAQLPAAAAYEDEANIFTLAGGVTLDNQLAVRLREADVNGDEFVEHRGAASIVTSQTYTWPVSTDDRFLSSGTAGALSWNQASGVGGCTNQFVRTLNNNAAPTCATVTSTDTSGTFPADSHNILGSVHGDALAGTVVLGDLIHGNVTPKLARLAGNSTTTKQYLSQTGTGAASAVPAWSQPAFSELSGSATAGQVPNLESLNGTLDVSSGGTGAAPGADDQALVSDSTSAATWRAIPNCVTNNMLTYTVATNTFGCDADDGAGGGAPVGVDYIVFTADATLTNEKLATDGIGIDVVSSGADAGAATFNFKYTDTLAGNPAFNAEECVFTLDGAGGGGFLCEGTVGANINEQLYLFPAVDGADTTNFIVVNGAQVTAVDGTALTVSSGTLNADSAAVATLGVIELDNALAGTAAAVEFAAAVAGAGLALNTATAPDSLDVTAGVGIAITADAVAFDFSDAGADPALAAGECRFSNEGASAAGWICEGEPANLLETRFRITDPTVADRIVTIPDADSSTVIADTGAANNFLTAISAAGVISKAQPAFSNLSGSATDGQLSTNVALYNNGSKTWGAGAGFNWTFDAGATDPVFEFTSGNVKFSGATTYTYEGGATDPVWTPGNSIMNLSTGTLQQGGTAVGLTTAPASAGTAPNWATGVLNIPLAVTASVTAGLISKTEFDTFNAKVGTATTDTLTNKTLDSEATGNALGTVSYIFLDAGGCQNVTAFSNFDLPTSGAAVAACNTGTNTQQGLLDFATDSGSLTAQRKFKLPTDWNSGGAVEARVTWKTAAIVNDVVWQVAIACVADAETDDPAFSDTVFAADTAKGTTNQQNDTAWTTITTTGTCAVDELAYLRLKRDPAHASDTLAAATTARLIALSLRIRRTQ